MYTINRSRTFVCIFAVIFLTVSASTSFATGSLNTDLGAFFENTMNSKMEKYHIPNATVSVVKDGKIVFKKGSELVCALPLISVMPLKLRISFVSSKKKISPASAFIILFMPDGGAI